MERGDNIQAERLLVGDVGSLDGSGERHDCGGSVSCSKKPGKGITKNRLCGRERGNQGRVGLYT